MTGERDQGADSLRTDEGVALSVRFQRDLYLYWEGVARMGSAPLTSRGLVARPALRRLLEPLDVGLPARREPQERTEADAPEIDRPRALFIRRSLERLGLLRLAVEGEARRLETAEARLMARYLGRSLGERVSILMDLWAGGAWWPDHLDPRAGLPGLQLPLAPRLATARRRALEVVASVPVGEAIPAPGRARRAHGTSRAARRRPIPSRLPAHAAAPDEDVMAAALAGPFSWLGLARWDAAGEAWIAGLPAQALRGGATDGDGAETPALLEQPGRVVAQSDLTITAYQPLTAPELWTLDLCGARETLDQIARYRLTRQDFARARAFGWDAAEVAQRLERLTGAALPNPARVALGDWERQASRLRVTTDATLLEVPDAATLDALQADRVAAAWVFRRLTSTAALISPEDAPRVRGWLLRHGLLPAVSDGAGD